VSRHRVAVAAGPATGQPGKELSTTREESRLVFLERVDACVRQLSSAWASRAALSCACTAVEACPMEVLEINAATKSEQSIPQSSPSKDIRNVSLSTVPSFVAGTLWFRVLGGSQLAYSFLTRQDFDVRLQSRVELDAPGSGGAPDTIRAGEILTSPMWKVRPFERGSRPMRSAARTT
jgi:hypothetical protein